MSIMIRSDTATHFLAFKAELDGVMKITPTNLHSIVYTVKCTQCGCERGNIRIEEEEQDVDGSRGNANFVMKCKDCQRQCKISYGRKEILSELKECEEFPSDTWMVIADFDCRGCSIESATCTEWEIISESENTYEWNGIDEFFEYDEDLERPVTVSNMELKVKSTKRR